MRYPILLCLLVAQGLLGQPNPKELVRQSIQNGAQSWKESFDYFCTQEDITRQLDSTGAIRGVDDDVFKIIPLGEHTFYAMPDLHDGEPVSRDLQIKSQRELNHLKAEGPAAKKRRFEKLAAERSYMKEIPDAFDFKIIGEENLPTGPAWVLSATPHPGYEAKSRYAHMFPDMRGKLWIDKHDVQWVKADAVAMDTVTFGFFIARLAKGSHIQIAQMKLPDGDWVPQRVDAKASARMFIFFNHRFEEDITYSNYRKMPSTVAAK